MDLGAVLDNGFSGKHTGLEKLREQQYTPGAQRGLMCRDKIC
jgi:hypothetical protein